jgi:hypothetical protein
MLTMNCRVQALPNGSVVVLGFTFTSICEARESITAAMRTPAFAAVFFELVSSDLDLLESELA